MRAMGILLPGVVVSLLTCASPTHSGGLSNVDSKISDNGDECAGARSAAEAAWRTYFVHQRPLIEFSDEDVDFLAKDHVHTSAEELDKLEELALLAEETDPTSTNLNLEAIKASRKVLHVCGP
ncbi:hypothetical protein ACFL6C_11430 [Myxococcota bacterium]